jgi:quercetin 2,3-dioxygenase
MPAVNADTLSLPRLPAPDPVATAWRPVRRVLDSHRTLEGEGFEVRRPFPGRMSLAESDPFLLLDQMGGAEHEIGPYRAKGAPDHPHRGFETVTYILDGELEHRDSHGGGGTIRGGETQWMTAGAGIVHSEMPTNLFYTKGGVMHGVQLWVNLPRSSKLVTPRYQDLQGGQLTLLSSDDGGTLIRLIAGELEGHRGPGDTYTPIVYAHASVAPGATLRIPWRTDFNAMAYVLLGDGTAGEERARIGEGQLAVFGEGDALVLSADKTQATHV